jgi:hypothetical protein
MGIKVWVDSVVCIRTAQRNIQSQADVESELNLL